MEAMTTQLDQLISRLQTEGVEAAQAQASAIIEQAEAQAKEIRAQAQAEAQAMKDKSLVELQARQTALDKRLRIAARDLVLLVQARLTQAYQDFLQANLAGQLDGKLLQECILALAKTPLTQGGWSLELPPETAQRMEQSLISAFAKELHAEVAIKAKEGLSPGFHLQQEGQRMYFDFTAERLTEIFYKQLSGNLKEVFGDLSAVQEEP